jgi:hypothetical protein
MTYSFNQYTTTDFQRTSEMASISPVTVSSAFDGGNGTATAIKQHEDGSGVVVDVVLKDEPVFALLPLFFLFSFFHQQSTVSTLRMWHVDFSRPLW